MTVYLDLVLFLNFAFDFLLLLAVNIVLKRNVKLRRILLGSIIGSLSILFLFIKLNSFALFLLKMIISIIMSLVTFKYKSLKYTFNNLLYLYMISTILGGFLYLLNIEFSYKQEGLVFYFKGLSINFIILLLVAPIIIYIYIRQTKSLKNNYSCYYKIEIIFKNNQSITLNAFLDTGNKLKDPITKKGIILINKEVIKGKYNIRSPMYVPYNSLNNHGLLKCFAPKYIVIENKIYTNFLVGLSDNKINIDGVDCLLNYKLMEELKC
ncbi:MAG: sigma-E processing peptidase SpoIIGA [Bacilli bacterium]|nr:sigma-E processing peptidase SpoIIGA [Bacilli bacterium]